jgi:hypothetical protein
VRRALVWAIAAAAIVASLSACGDDDGVDARAPAGGFAQTLGEVSTGPIPLGVGYGYVDLATLRGEDVDWAAGALGPGGSILVTDSAQIARRTGFDPTTADRLLSVAASYTLGVRADGVDPGPVADALIATADTEGVEGKWEHLDFGSAWSVPNGKPTEILSGLGARVALGPNAVVAARTDRARTELTTPSEEVLTDPAVRASLECLGDPVAARIVPNNFTHAPNSGPQLLAFGVSDPAEGPVTETLCAADPSADVVDETVAALEDQLALDAVDPVTDMRIDESATAVEVDELEGDGAGVARARLTLRDDADPGYFFDAFVHGSVITYLGLAAPEPQ